MDGNANGRGGVAEEIVSGRLAGAGWTILARNVRIGRRELDIVAVDPSPPGSLVVVEVRWRTRRDFGLPEETVGHRKRQHLRAASFGLLERGTLPNGLPLPPLPLRIDLVVVEPRAIRHYRAAV